MTDLRQAAELALEALIEDVMVEVEPNVWEYKSIVAIQALRQALDDKPPVKSYCRGKPNYCTPVDAVPGFTVTEPRQSLSRMKPGDRFVLVRTGEICRIKNDGSQWNETAQRPSRFHKNSQVRLIVDAVNMTPDRVDETAKGEHEPVAWLWKNQDGHQVLTDDPDYADGTWTPLYTAPPQKEEGCAECGKQASQGWALYCVECAGGQEWVGLTHEERFLNDCRSPEEIEYAKAIEAKLKEKNEST